MFPLLHAVILAAAISPSDVVIVRHATPPTTVAAEVVSLTGETKAMLPPGVITAVDGESVYVVSAAARLTKYDESLHEVMSRDLTAIPVDLRAGGGLLTIVFSDRIEICDSRDLKLRQTIAAPANHSFSLADPTGYFFFTYGQGLLTRITWSATVSFAVDAIDVIGLSDGGFIALVPGSLDVYDPLFRRIRRIPLPEAAHAMAIAREAGHIWLALADRVVKLRLRDMQIVVSHPTADAVETPVRRLLTSGVDLPASGDVVAGLRVPAPAQSGDVIVVGDWRIPYEGYFPPPAQLLSSDGKKKEELPNAGAVAISENEIHLYDYDITTYDFALNVKRVITASSIVTDIAAGSGGKLYTGDQDWAGIRPLQELDAFGNVLRTFPATQPTTSIDVAGCVLFQNYFGWIDRFDLCSNRTWPRVKIAANGAHGLADGGFIATAGQYLDVYDASGTRLRRIDTGEASITNFSFADDPRFGWIVRQDHVAKIRLANGGEIVRYAFDKPVKVAVVGEHRPLTAAAVATAGIPTLSLTATIAFITAIAAAAVIVLKTP
ncbi:MAG TPA: hypothetical protein VFN10_17555 [Thermoanaerobaculia bacterium]|nr:hypothetical protein [Thermoanaerobaculia bacterium]